MEFVLGPDAKSGRMHAQMIRQVGSQAYASAQCHGSSGASRAFVAPLQDLIVPARTAKLQPRSGHVQAMLNHVQVSCWLAN